MKRIYILIAIILFIFVAYPFMLNSMAGFLNVKDKIEKADGILVLAGDSNGERVAQAVELYKAGWAPKVLMSGGPAVWNLTYAQNMRRQATSLGVPDKDVLLQDKSKSTIQDIEFSLPIIKGLNAKTIILVTSPYHIRRASLVARKHYNKEGIKIIAYPAQKSSFDPNNWWTRYEDTASVVWEYVAMVEYLLKGKLI